MSQGNSETNQDNETPSVSAKPWAFKKNYVILGVFCIVVIAVCALAAMNGGSPKNGAGDFAVIDRSGGAPIMGNNASTAGTVVVVCAKKNIRKGAILSADDLSQTEIRVIDVPDNAVGHNAAVCVGRVVRKDIKKGSVVLSSDLGRQVR